MAEGLNSQRERELQNTIPKKPYTRLICSGCPVFLNRGLSIVMLNGRPHHTATEEEDQEASCPIIYAVLIQK